MLQTDPSWRQYIVVDAHMLVLTVLSVFPDAAINRNRRTTIVAKKT